MVAWSLKCNIWIYIFLDFNEHVDNCKKSYLMVKHTIFISTEYPFHTLLFGLEKISICKNFILQRSIGKKKGAISKFKNS